MLNSTPIQRVTRLFSWRYQDIQRVPRPERYERSPDGRVIIHVHLNSPSSLLMPFEQFPVHLDNRGDRSNKDDKNNKDTSPSRSNLTPPVLNLDTTLVDYLFNCVAEVGNKPLLLHVTIPFTQNSEISEIPEIADLPSTYAPVCSTQLLQTTTQQYFADLEERLWQNLKLLARDVGGFGLAGISALGLSILLNSYIDQIHTGDQIHTRFALSLCSQGITVFGWVTFWNALTNALWNWRPIYQQLRICQQLQQAQFELSNF